MRPKPDLVVATGDLYDNSLAEEYRLLRELLDRFSIPVLVIPGNHDEIGPLVEVLDNYTHLPSDGGPLQYVIEGDVRGAPAWTPAAAEAPRLRKDRGLAAVGCDALKTGRSAAR